MSIDAQAISAQLPSLATGKIELATLGYTIVKKCVSPTLVDKVSRGHHDRISYEYIRRIWDGVPAFLCEQSIGKCIFSVHVRMGHESDVKHSTWYRGRTDTVVSGAPRDFVPGFDLITPLEAGMNMSIMPASGRLSVDEFADFSTAHSVRIGVEDLIILDSRIYRRVDVPVQAIQISVVRDWIAPLDLQADGIAATVPERAADFFGRRLLAHIDLREWLIATRP